MKQTRPLDQDERKPKTIFGNRKLAIILTLTLGLVVSCSAIAYVSRAHNQPASEVVGPNSPAVSAPAPSMTAAPPTPHELVTTVKFSLFDVGIYPREAHAEEGLVWIIIEDYFGGNAGLVVERETGNALEHVGSVQRDGPHWRGKSDLRLGPGRYRVHMADRPANQAVLIVGPRGK